MCVCVCVCVCCVCRPGGWWCVRERVRGHCPEPSSAALCVFAFATLERGAGWMQTLLDSPFSLSIYLNSLSLSLSLANSSYAQGTHSTNCTLLLARKFRRRILSLASVCCFGAKQQGASSLIAMHWIIIEGGWCLKFWDKLRMSTCAVCFSNLYVVLNHTCISVVRFSKRIIFIFSVSNLAIWWRYTWTSTPSLRASAISVSQ